MRHEPFELGRHDCFRLTCHALEALTGVDRWPEFAGYRTDRDVLRLILRHGDSFEAAFDWFFGAPSISVCLAQRGDICVGVSADGSAPLGVCLGVDAAFVGAVGLDYLPTRSCVRAWRVR